MGVQAAIALIGVGPGCCPAMWKRQPRHGESASMLWKICTSRKRGVPFGRANPTPTIIKIGIALAEPNRESRMRAVESACGVT